MKWRKTETSSHNLKKARRYLAVPSLCDSDCEISRCWSSVAAHRAADLDRMCSCSHRHRIQSGDGHDCLSLWPTAVEVAEGQWGTLSRSIPTSFVRWRPPRWRNPWGSIYQDVGKFVAAVAIEN